MNLTFFEMNLSDEIREKLAGHNVNFTPGTLTQSNAKDFADSEIISPGPYADLSPSTLGIMKGLKLIALRSTGYENADLVYCRERGITVCNVPEYGGATVAEHVFGLLLTISHNITEAVNRTRAGDFSLKGLKGFDLAGKKLGVIGTGRIGARVIRIARAFDMEALAWSRTRRKELEDAYGAIYMDLKDVLSSADIITLHLPYGPQTHHILSRGEFEAMRDGVIIINTSRGDVVDTIELVKALGSGRVRAAGLDVLPKEKILRDSRALLEAVTGRDEDCRTLLEDYALLRMKNVFITPHSAFYTEEALRRMMDTAIGNILSFIEGRPRNVVS